MPDAPWPLIEVAVEPRDAIASAQLREVLDQLTAADPSFVVGHDPESGQTVLKGMSEAHLEHKARLLLNVYGIACNFG